MRGVALLIARPHSTSERGRRQSPLASRRLQSGLTAEDPAAMARSAPVPVLLLLLLLATSSASPVLHGYDDVGGHSTTAHHEPNDSTWRQEGVAVTGWNSGRSDPVSATNSQSTSLGIVYGGRSPDEGNSPPQELDTAQGVSTWDDDKMEDSQWKLTVSPAGSFEDGEQQPPIDKYGSPGGEFTDDPNFSWGEDSATQLNGIKETKKELKIDGKRSEGGSAERTPPPPENVTGLGPEVGSEEFDELLGGALNEVLRKVKKVLAEESAAAERNGGEIGDWRPAFSRLRVKRSEDQSEDDSEDESEDAEDLPVRSLNDIVDVFLIIARQSLEDRGLDQVSIPPLMREFSRSLGVATLRGFFRGDDGWVRRLTTVRRVGPVRLDRGPRPPEGEPWDLRTVSVSTSLGLEELTVGFERYVADVRALPTVSGRLLADIDENVVLLNISFSKRDDDPKGCDVFLQELKIVRLEGINLKLTGLGPLNWLLSRIATWLTTHSQEKVAAVVQKELVKIANKELQNIPCDADFITALSML